MKLKKQQEKNSFSPLAWLYLTLCFGFLLPSQAHAAFGLTSDTNFYTVDTGAGLTWKVRRTDNGSSTQSAGDIASLVYNGVEYQNQSRGSQINSGFDFLYNGVSAVTVSAALIGTDYVKVTVEAGNLTHYYLARRGYPHIYMGTHFTSEPDTLNLCRYIVRIPASLLPNGPAPSDIRNNTGAIEASDVFGLANGETRSKHYTPYRLMDYSYTGATGTNVGVFMVRSNHEGGSGGPFYRSLLNQCGTDQEIYEIINYGEAQTEPFRFGVFNGPYILAFTNGAPPAVPIDTSWIHSSGIDATLKGWVQNRGYTTGQATGIPNGFQGVVGFANATAQYWCVVNNGSYTSPWMIPGTYTMTLYKGELAVATNTVTVAASTTPVTKNIASAEVTRLQRWRIGEWDGTPAGFLNADKVTTMHPSDVRMSPWGPVTYTVGSSSPGSFPCYQWKDVNNPTTIKFDLTPGQLTAHTLRVGLTCAFEGARPRVSVNGWTSTIPSPSTQPDTRTLTVGTYRGNNVTYTYEIPASAFVAGTNTMTLTVVSGSGSTRFLSAGYSYDAIELDAPFNGTYRITPQHAQDKALNVANPANSAQIDIYAYQGQTQQQFLLDPQSDGSYRIRTALAGNRCVELPFGNAANGTLIKLWDDNGNDAQRWYLMPVVGEWYKIVPKNDATKCIDVYNFGTANSTPVVSWDYLGGSNQLWRLTPVSDDVFVEFSAGAYTVDESDGQATITVTRSGNLSLPASINYATSDGTAVQPDDYNAALGTLNFAANQSSQSFAVSLINDSLDETDETLNLTLSTPQNGAVLRGQTTATLTITDDDLPPLPTLSVNDASAVIEGSVPVPGAVIFTVTLSAPSAQVVTVDYATQDGSAGQTNDYIGAAGTLSFAPDETSKTVTVTLKGDVVNEATENFKLNLSAAVNATVADSQGIGTITDDDRAPTLSINDVAVQEGNSGTVSAIFTITLSAVSGQTVTVSAITANGSARSPGDYTGGGIRLTFTPGETSKTFSVPVSGDLLNEANEVFYVLLSSPVNAILGRARGVATVVDNDVLPSISIENVSIGEGNSGTRLAVFHLRLSAPSGQLVKASYATAPGTVNTASAGSDYQAVAPTEVAFTTGQTVTLARVVINGELLHEPNETLLVNLSNPVNATISDDQALGTILNDDAIPSLVINDVAVVEGNSGTRTLNFVVSLNGASGQTVTVNYATANGTARSGTDYTAQSGTLSFVPGTPSTQTISILINGDAELESDETLYVLLSGAANAAVGRARGVGTITNDDASG